MIIGGHAMLGIDARSLELHDVVDRTGDDRQAHTPDKGTRLLEIRFDDPGEGARGPDGDVLDDDPVTGP